MFVNKLFLNNYIPKLIFLDEKVQLSSDMHELMTKYLRRLDHELHKFKMELEADNSGITGLIEKSKNIQLFLKKKHNGYNFSLFYYIYILGSLDSEQGSISIPNQKENKYQLNRCLFGGR